MNEADSRFPTVGIRNQLTKRDHPPEQTIAKSRASARAILAGFGAANKLGAATKKLNAVLLSPSLVIDFADSDAKTGSDFLGRKKAMTSKRHPLHGELPFRPCGIQRSGRSTMWPTAVFDAGTW